MSLSSSTLTAIQKVGAAAFVADEKLKKEVKEYAERVNAAIAKNAYGPGNDALIENWKAVARISQTLVGIEEELKKVYQVAADLTSYDQGTEREVPMLAAPTRFVAKGVQKQLESAPAAVKPLPKTKASNRVSSAVAAPKRPAKQKLVSQADLTPTDAVVNRKKTATPSKAKASKAKVAAAAEKNSPALGGNPSKLLAYFERVLNWNEFTEVSQTVAAQEAGIPLGSMTAAIKKLLESGRIAVGAAGSLKLVTTQPVLPAASQTPLAALDSVNAN